MGYAFFSKGDFNLNIIGVRNPNQICNSFDDTLMLAYKINGRWILKEWSITTDAGRYWLLNPMNSKGTAILIPNQYRGAYGIAEHRNKYEALCQVNAKVDVWRDNNKDQILDFNNATAESGYFGINIHRSNPNGESEIVEKWSAGCQVFQNSNDFNEFMNISKTAAKIWGNSFTYTLMTEEQLYLLD